MAKRVSNRITTSEQTNSDDNSSDFTDFRSSSDDKVNDNNALLTYFEPSGDVHPTFFQGSLQDACQTAFGSTRIDEHRTVLVYISGPNSRLKTESNGAVSPSNEVICYLNANYIVCRFEFTSKSSISELDKIWQEIFSVAFSQEFSLKQCPLLIGILPFSRQKTNTEVTLEYQFKELARGNWLIAYPGKINHENFFETLKAFKKECDENEKNLSFNFVEKTGLSWEVILHIAEYLSLNDAVAAFSSDVLPLLNHCQTKFQLIEVGDFQRRILPKIDSTKIVSIQPNMDRFSSRPAMNFFTGILQITSMTLRGLRSDDSITRYTQFYQNLIRLCLFYDKQTNYYQLLDRLNELPKKIKYLEIHCSNIILDHLNEDRLLQKPPIMPTIEYFLFDVNYEFVSEFYLDYYRYDPCYTTAMRFIQNMPNIRQIHLIGRKYNLAHFADQLSWSMLIFKCQKLKKVKMEGFKYSSEEKDSLVKTLAEIQTQLRRQRPEIQFQIKFF